MIYIYIYLAIFVIVLATTLWSYKDTFDKYRGFWQVFKDSLLMSILWVVFVPTAILILVKDCKKKKECKYV